MIVTIIVFALLIAYAFCCVSEQTKERAEYKAQCKHIQREYNGMKFNITIRPWSESNKIWQCKYTSIDESIEDCFYFADYPSIEEQMEKHIAPQVTSMTRWQKRLQEIAEIS